MVAVVVLDCGIGNLRSVQKAFEKAGAEAPISNDPEAMRRAEAIVLPGVGAFLNAMERMRKAGLVEPVRQAVLERKTPILGICLGMQLLARESDEGGTQEGLGLIAAKVEKIDVAGRRNWAQRKLTLPHIGWNAVTPRKDSALFAGIEADTDFYFVHNYRVRCEDETDVAATCEYGYAFACAIEHGHIFGAQFHPEKSQKAGAALIGNFLDVCRRAREAA